ncbi:MAG: hypothetical protein ACXWFI_14510 [Methylobacter sp.]
MSDISRNDSNQFDALKALYDGQIGTLKTLSERSFTVTLQALTLNLAVVAALIGSKVLLSQDGKLIGTILLLIFNVLVVAYLASKSCAHDREKHKLVHVQNSIAKIAAVDIHFTNNHPSFVRSFFGGSGIFISCVVLSSACAVSAFWVSLVTQDGYMPVNPAVEVTLRDKTAQLYLTLAI